MVNLDFVEEFIDSNQVLNINAFNGTSMQKEADVFVESFWYWNKFSSYLMSLFTIISILSILTYCF